MSLANSTAGWVNSLGLTTKTFVTNSFNLAASNEPNVNVVANTSLDVNPYSLGDNRTVMAAAVSTIKAHAGSEAWWYNGSRPWMGNPQETEDDGLSPRSSQWSVWKKQLTGYFFWDSTYYNDTQTGGGVIDVFNNAVTFGAGSQASDPLFGLSDPALGNGNGVLFYPGTDTVYPASNYNQIGMFASLRLKYWRRGIQDYDYIALANSINPAATAAIVAGIMPQTLWDLFSLGGYTNIPINWPTNPDTWEAARASLAAIIGNGPPATSLASVSGSTLTSNTLTYAAQTALTSSAAQTITFGNTGNSVLSIGSMLIGGVNAADFAIATNTCSSTLAVGATCALGITFTPSVTGARTATLTLTDSATSSPQVITLNGTGNPAGTSLASVSGSTLTSNTLTYASQATLTTSAAQTITFSNTGTLSLNIGSMLIGGANAADFAIATNTCTSTLASGSCSLGITFTPSVTGARTATLTLTDSATSSPQVITLNGTGAALSGGNTSGTFTSKATGNWNATGQTTWNEVGYPGPGSTVTIANGHTITVTANQSVGASGLSDSTPAVLINGTGQLVISTGVTFSPQGDVLSAQTGATTPYVVMNAGSHSGLERAQRAILPRAGGTGNNAVEPFQINGTSGARASLSVTGGGGAVFSADTIAGGAHTYGGSLQAYYTDFSGLGDATHNALSIAYLATGSAVVTYDVEHCSFTKCGLITDGGIPWGANTTCLHKYNVHSQSQNVYADFQMDAGTAAVGSGAREISYNVFDRNLGNLSGNESMTVGSFTIKENYIAGIIGVQVQSAPWTSFDTNLLVAPSMGFNVPYTVNNNLFYVSGGAGNNNPHVLAIGAVNGAANATNNIFATNSPYGGQGDLVLNNTDFASTIATHAITYNLVLPSIAGDDSGALLSFLGGAGDNLSEYTVEHNTSPTGGEGFINLESWSPAMPAGHILSVRNNIVYSLPGATSYSTMIDYAASTGTPVQNPALPANVDYNDGYGVQATNSNSAFLNEGKGYWASWTATPGAHDLAAAPSFKDATRSVQTFASAYLSNTAPAWVTGHAYAVGDIAAHTFTGSFNGSNVLYRCIQAHTSGATNTPGDNNTTFCVGSTVSACTNYVNYWEDASLYYIRQAMAAGSTYSGYGITNGTAIDILNAWIKDGFAPQNASLHNAGSDGSDLGAVAYQASGGGTAANFAIGSTVLQSGVKGVGVNLGQPDYYDSLQMMKNLTSNSPGMNPPMVNVVVGCLSASATSCTPNGSPYVWGGSTTYWPAGTAVLVKSGAAKGCATTLSGYNGTAFNFAAACGTTLSAGDYIQVGPYLAYGTTSLLQSAVSDPTWTSITGAGAVTAEASDLPSGGGTCPDTSSLQAMALTAPGATDQAAIHFRFDTLAGHQFVKLNGTYRIQFCAKKASGSGQITLSFDRNGSTCLAPTTIATTAAWAPSWAIFTANEAGFACTAGAACIAETTLATVLGAADSVEITNIDTEQCSTLQTGACVTDTANPTVFRDEVVTALQQLKPGSLRMWAGNATDTLDESAGDPVRTLAGYVQLVFSELRRPKPRRVWRARLPATLPDRRRGALARCADHYQYHRGKQLDRLSQRRSGLRLRSEENRTNLHDSLDDRVPENSFGILERSLE